MRPFIVDVGVSVAVYVSVDTVAFIEVDSAESWRSCSGFEEAKVNGNEFTSDKVKDNSIC